jgi:hypothetical protein
MRRWELCPVCDGLGGQCQYCAGAGQVIVDVWPPYSFTDHVAAAARAASRKYWANRDREIPVHGDVYEHWPIDDPTPPHRPTTERGKPG